MKRDRAVSTSLCGWNLKEQFSTFVPTYAPKGYLRVTVKMWLIVALIFNW